MPNPTLPPTPSKSDFWSTISKLFRPFFSHAIHSWCKNLHASLSAATLYVPMSTECSPTRQCNTHIQHHTTTESKIILPRLHKTLPTPITHSVPHEHPFIIACHMLTPYTLKSINECYKNPLHFTIHTTVPHSMPFPGLQTTSTKNTKNHPKCLYIPRVHTTVIHLIPSITDLAL